MSNRNRKVANRYYNVGTSKDKYSSGRTLIKATTINKSTVNNLNRAINKLSSKPGVRNNRKRNFRNTARSYSGGASFGGGGRVGLGLQGLASLAQQMQSSRKDKDNSSNKSNVDDFGIGALGNSWNHIKSYLTAYGAHSAIGHAEFIKSYYPGGIYQYYNSQTGRKSGRLIIPDGTDNLIWFTLLISNYWNRFVDAILYHSKMKTTQAELLINKIANIIVSATGNNPGGFRYLDTAIKNKL